MLEHKKVNMEVKSMKILKLPFNPGKSITIIDLIKEKKERLVRYSNVLKSNK